MTKRARHYLTASVAVAVVVLAGLSLGLVADDAAPVEPAGATEPRSTAPPPSGSPSTTVATVPSATTATEPDQCTSGPPDHDEPVIAPPGSPWPWCWPPPWVWPQPPPT